MNFREDVPVEIPESIENFFSTTKDNPISMSLVKPLCVCVFPQSDINKLPNSLNIESDYFRLKKKDRNSVFTVRLEKFGSVIYDNQNYRFFFLNSIATDIIRGNISLESLHINENFKSEFKKLCKVVGITNSEYGYNLKFLKHRTSSEKQPLFSAPLKVFFDVTARCNLNCKYCWYSSNIRNNIGELSLDSINILFKNLYNMGVFELNIAGGEPFIRKDILKIIELGKKLFPGLTISTNGLLLTEKHLDFLGNLPIRYLNISLDGRKSIHNYLRGEGTYSKVLAIIKKTKSYISNVGLSVTITSLNIRSINEILIIAENVGVKSVSFGFVRICGNAIKYSDVLIPNKYQILKFLEEFDNIQGKYNLDLWLETDIPRTTGYKFNLKNRFFKKTYGCGAGWVHCKIKPNGTMTPCGYMNVESTGSALNPQDFETIWNRGRSFEKLRTLRQAKICKNCEFITKNCLGGCRARASSIGLLDEIDPFCILDVKANKIPKRRN